MMKTKADNLTRWVSRIVFAFLCVIITYLVGSFGWQPLLRQPFVCCMLTIGLIASGTVTLTGHKPAFVRGDPVATPEAGKRILTMLFIFVLSGVVIGTWLWWELN